MTIRTRIFIAFFLLFGVGIYYLTHWIQEDLRERYLETMEEAMVDMSALLASQVEENIQDKVIPTEALGAAFKRLSKRKFSATIYQVTKTQYTMNVYITDQHGIVLFDSGNEGNVGQDFSDWNDVHLTLRGRYGARSTRSIRSDPTSSIMHVAAPIYIDTTIVGVLTLYKPVDSVTMFMVAAEQRILTAGMLTTAMIVFLGLVLSFWITHPIAKLTHYARAVRDGKRVSLPKLGRNEIASLGIAFDEMRVALEQKNYIEEYVQALTHEIKSPLSSIKGAVELLSEEMEEEQRLQFLENLHSESERIQDLVDRMLQLTALENRKELHDLEEVDPRELCTEMLQSLQPVLSTKEIHVDVDIVSGISIQCERFLIRQSLSNLIQNAIDFSKSGDTISIQCEIENDRVTLTIRDQGPGIPVYAKDKIFNRFYSLSRPSTGKKSTGLGLAFVKEVADLHGGDIHLESPSNGGTIARFSLPRRQ